MAEASGSTDSGSNPVQALVKRARDGEREAVEALIQKYRPWLRVVAQRAVRQMFVKKFDASDVVQHTCMEIFNSIARFEWKTEAEFHAWLTKIVQRNVTNFVRTHSAQMRDVRREFQLGSGANVASLEWFEGQDAGNGPGSRIIRGEAALQLAEALSHLTEGQRTAVQMRFLEGCKVSEIAAYMEVKPSSVSRLIARGIEALRKRLPGELSD